MTGTGAQTETPARLPSAVEAATFPGRSAMAERCRAFDWAATPLGPVERWSHALRTTVGIVLTSRQPMFLFWGPALVQLHNDDYRPSLGSGGRAEHALGARGREFWTDIWDTIGPQIEQVMTTGEATWHEDQYLPIVRNGRVEDVWWTYCYGPVRDDDGRVGGVLVVCQETTQRVRATDALREANAALAVERSRLAEVFRLSPAFLAVLRGPEHTFVSVNDAYTRLVGGRDVVGRPLREALPEARGQGFVELLDRVVATGEPYVGREIPVHVGDDGDEPRVLDFQYLPLVEVDGAGERRTAGVIAHGIDVTEQVYARRQVERLLADAELARAQAEAARAEAEHARERTAQLQALTAALAGAHTLDDVATIVVAEMVVALGARTGALAVRAGDAEALVLARTVGFPALVDDRVRTQPLDMQSPLTEAFRTRAPVWVERRDGPDGLDARYPPIAPVWDVLGVASAVFVPLVVAGAAVGVISFAFEGTRAFAEAERAFLLALGQQAAVAVERARLFEAEHAARQDAEAANRAKSDFLAVMSHELRTPLNAIGGYAELLELGVRGPVTADQRVDLARIQRAQRHLLGLINEVLNYARVDAGAVHYELEAVPMDEVLATCEALVAPQVRAKGLELRHTACDDSLRARADREKVQQVVLNLLSNAVKFTAPGGTITLDCAVVPGEAGEVVAVRVSDTGRGIPRDQLARVFHPFVQIDARLTRTQEGTGLGLAISRDLARGMGGDLTAESTEGVGSAFTLTLPHAGT